MNQWVKRPLGSVATLQRGFDLPHRERQAGNVPIVTSAGPGGFHDRAMVPGPGVVTGRYGTIGKVFFLDQDFWPLNTTLWVSNFHGNNERFVYYLLQRVDYATHSGKSGVPGVNRNDLHSEIIGLPVSKAEQQEIAAVISTVDELIASLKQLIRKKREIKQGLMQELLTGRSRLPGFTAPWIERHLGELANIKTGSRNNQDKSKEGRFPCFVRSATVERIDSFSYDGEAILVPGEGGVGSIFHYVDGKFEVQQRVYMISDFSEDVSARFVYQYMRQFFGKHALGNTVKATVDSLRLPTFTGFILKLPPTREEQNGIARVLFDADQEITLLERQIESTRSIKQGMMQELLTGRTRLTQEDAP